MATLRRPGAWSERLAAAGVEVAWLGRRFWCDPIAALRLRRLARARDADVVQSWDAPSSALCRYALRGLAGVAWVETIRDIGTKPRPRADHTVASDEAVAAAIAEAGLPRERVSVVPNAYEPRLATPCDRRVARAALRRAGVDIADGAPVIAMATRLDDPQRVNELVWASDLVRVVRPGLRLLVVGEGSGRLACERFAASATEPGTVQWLGAWPDQATALAAADVVWCGEGGGAAPTPVVEAMAAGRAVVAADGPGRDTLLPAEEAPDGLPPLRVPLGERAAWARATDRLLADPARAEAIGDANAQRVRSERSIEAVAAAHADALGAARR